MPLEIQGWTPADRPEVNYIPRVVAAKTAQNRFRSSLANGYRGSIPHWDVPPAFADPKRALIELGLEAYKSACQEYYQALNEQGVANAQRLHGRWVVRRCMSAFETQVRRFRRHSGRGGTQQGLLIDPQELYRNGAMMLDIEWILKRWQVAEELRPAMIRLLRAKLESTWGVAE